MYFQLILILFNYLIINQHINGTAADYSLFGLIESYLIPIDARKVSEIYSSCYGGLNLLHCVPQLPDDDIVTSYDRPYYLALSTLTSTIGGLQYCLECCGNPPDYVDTWDLYCEMNAGTIITTNVYGYEVRMARNRDSTDTEIIKCPIRRSACSYTDTGETIECDRVNDKTFLLGYTVTFTVEQYDANFDLWRGVSSCEVESFEETTSLKQGDNFHEKIIMKHVPINTLSATDFGKIAIISISCFLGIYLFLYFCRKKRCEYCYMKLVFSPRLCYKCVIVGAQRPDPVLLAALEEKTRNIQGDIPENFIFYQSFVHCFWCIILIPRSIYRSFQSCLGFVCCCCFSKQRNNISPIKVSPLINKKSFTKKMKDLESAIKNKQLNDDDDDEEDNQVYPITQSEQQQQQVLDHNWMTDEQKEEEEIKSKYALKSKKYARKLKKEKRLKENENNKNLYLKTIEIKKKNPNILNYDINTIYQAVNVKTI